MPFDWREFLVQAKNLVGYAGFPYSQEAAERSAVSRAYFAAFCLARNYAEAQLNFKRSGDAKDHKRLREHLKNSGKAQMASRMNRLRDWRNDCDYKDEVRNLKRLVKYALENADKVIEECR